MEIIVFSPAGDLEGTVPDDSDLDGTFTLVTDEGERFRVNGWQCDIEIID